MDEKFGIRQSYVGKHHEINLLTTVERRNYLVLETNYYKLKSCKVKSCKNNIDKLISQEVFLQENYMIYIKIFIICQFNMLYLKQQVKTEYNVLASC